MFRLRKGPLSPGFRRVEGNSPWKIGLRGDVVSRDGGGRSFFFGSQGEAEGRVPMFTVIGISLNIGSSRTNLMHAVTT